MKCLFINTFYENFLDDIYKKDHIDKLNYTQQIRALNNSCFGDSDFYSYNLSLQGWECQNIIINAEILQRQWCRENHYTYTNPFNTTFNQIKNFNPDVIYIQDLDYMPLYFIKTLKEMCKLLVGQRACNGYGNNYELYNIIFSALPDYVKFYNKKIKSYYIPLAFEARILNKIQLKDYSERKFNYIFIGGVSNVHSERHNLIKLLDKIDTQFWGYGFDTLPFKVKNYNGESWGLDMFSLMSNSKIVINKHTSLSKNFITNMRNYEVTGAGSLLLSDNINQNNINLFNENTEFINYTSSEDCIEKIHYYAEHEDEAKKIAEAGQKRTLTEHTYKNRMETISNILIENLNGK